MNTEESLPDSYRLTHQQQRFCDEYLTHFNAFKAAVNSGYSENTSRKGALLHVPKIQQYLKEAMNRRSQRLEITHDMILRELSKIAFSNMGNYYDEYGCLKRMNELTVDEKGAIAYYDIVEIQDGEGYRVGQQSKIKLHNKMSALDKIARHLGFYGTLGREVKGEREKAKGEGDGERRKGESGKEESVEGGLLVRTPTKAAGGSAESEAESPESKAAVVDRSTNNLPMDYPEEDFELEGIDLKTQMALEEVNVSPGRFLFDEVSLESESPEVRKKEGGGMKPEVADGIQKSFLLQASALQHKTENVENILTISPLVKRETRLSQLTNDYQACL